MKPINTKAHGVLDYSAVVVVFVLPHLLHWGAGLTQFMTWMAAGALLYTLLTRFELGAIKVLPVPAHLVLDFLVGAAFLVTAFTLHGEPSSARIALIVLGLLEIGAALMTQTTPSAQVTGVQTQSV